jgi:hypothetical protein
MICNLALAHLGDTANIASLLESSVQAQLCAQFYPVARNALLEMSTWGFATRRVKLALVTNPTLAIAQGVDPSAQYGTWKYAYALPSGVINAIAVLPAGAAGDYEAKFGPAENGHSQPYPQGYMPVPGASMYMPQPYAIETQIDGSQIVLTNVCDAVLRYTTVVTDTTKFGPLFTLALSWLLASMLAGPILKGDAGAAEGARCLGMFKSFEGLAESSDANQRKTNVEPAVSWIRGR